jgi:hypothetical protein
MNKFWPCPVEEMEDRGSFISQPLLPDNVAMLVPSQQRSLYAVIAQNLKDVEALIAQLDLGVGVAASGRALVRDLYVQCRKQREILEAALRLKLE